MGNVRNSSCSVQRAVPILHSLTVTAGNAGSWSFYAAWVYGSLCMATFIVRTMKRVLFREARQYSKCSAAVQQKNCKTATVMSATHSIWAVGTRLRHLPQNVTAFHPSVGTTKCALCK